VTEAGLLDVKQLDAVDAETAAMIDEAARKAKAAAAPAPDRLLTDVYVSY